MKRLCLLALPLLFVIAAGAQEAPLMTDDQKTLYVLGTVLGHNVGVFGLSADELRFVTMGLKDSVEGRPLKADPAEFGPKVTEMAKKRQEARSAVEKEKAKAYLDKAAKEKGVVKTPSGLLYKELKAGAGPSPKAADQVKVHYHGTFTDGKVFDSSVERKSPATFPLNGVIPCWTEGVQKMKVGGKARLICPSDIAYGDQGRPSIPGGATLVFEVELLEIVKQP